MITVYTATFNESKIIQFFIDHYRSRFPNCDIVVYDNESTDKTVEIAKLNNCEIIPYSSNGVINDQLLMDIKNTCWKSSKTDWVLTCDTDELLDINEQQLTYENSCGTTKIKSEAWQMVNMADSPKSLKDIKYGWRDNVVGGYCLPYDKDLLFNKKHVDINYVDYGCHTAHSKGTIKYSDKPYKMYHYKYTDINAFLAKQRLNRSKITAAHIKLMGGNNCLKDDNGQRAEFNLARRGAIKIFE